MTNKMFAIGPYIKCHSKTRSQRARTGCCRAASYGRIRALNRNCLLFKMEGSFICIYKFKKYIVYQVGFPMLTPIIRSIKLCLSILKQPIFLIKSQFYCPCRSISLLRKNNLYLFRMLRVTFIIVIPIQK